MFHEVDIPIFEPILIIGFMLVIMLISPVVFERVRVPSIVGLLVMGALIGPNGFNLLAPELEFTLLGTFGLQYLMFLAGLEIDFIDFIRHKAKSIFLGLMAFVIPFAIGFGACFYVLDFSILASLLIASMLSSHTLIAYPILGKLGISSTAIVTIIIGATIIADILALLSMEVVTDYVKDISQFKQWGYMFLRFAILILFSFMVIPRLAKWFFKHYEGDLYVQYVFVITLLFVTAGLAHILGIEAIIGSFLCGLMLNRYIVRTSTLFMRIEFIGNSLFIPIFLISVGMLVNFRGYVDEPVTLWVLGVLIVAAFAGKWLSSLLTRFIFRLNRMEGQLMFGLTMARAASAIAIILIGYNLGIVDEMVINHTVVLILATSIGSTYITRSAGKKVAVAEEHASPEKKQEEKILIPVANPETMPSLLDFGVLIKQGESGPLYPLSIVTDRDKHEEMVEEKRRLIEQNINKLGKETTFRIINRIDVNVTNGIERACKEMQITTTVLGWHQQITPFDSLFGGILKHLLRRVDKMIMVLRTPIQISSAQKMLVFVPKHGEHEIGFPEGLAKVQLLAKRLKSEVTLYCADSSLEEVKLQIRAHNHANIKKFETTETYEKSCFVIKPGEKDLLVFIKARRGTMSYSKGYEQYMKTTADRYPGNPLLLIYPEQ